MLGPLHRGCNTILGWSFMLMCVFRVTGTNAELHIVVFYLCTCAHAWLPTTNGAVMLAKKLLFPHIYTLCITDTNLIKNCWRMKGVHLMSVHVVAQSLFSSALSPCWLRLTNEWWGLGEWFLGSGIVWGPRWVQTLPRYPGELRSVSAKSTMNIQARLKDHSAKSICSSLRQHMERVHGEFIMGTVEG